MTELSSLDLDARACTAMTGAAVSADVSQAAAAWLLSYDSVNTRRAYSRTITEWALWCEQVGVLLLLVRRAHLDTYARSLSEHGQSAATVARTLAALSSFYRYTQGEELITSNPVEIVRRPKLSADFSPTVGLSRSQAAHLLITAGNHSPRSAALVNLLLANGLRIGEALGVDVTDLGSTQGHHTLSITRKGGMKSLIPLAPHTAHAVHTYIGQCTEGRLFVTQTGRRWDQPGVFRHLRSLARRAGIENADKLSPHSLRHTSITAGLDAGVSLRDMQDFAGHADPRTTRRYDRHRHNLDCNPTYTIANYLAATTENQ